MRKILKKKFLLFLFAVWILNLGAPKELSSTPFSPLWFSKRSRPPVDGIDPLKGLSSTRPILRAARAGGSAQFARGEECAAFQPEIMPPAAPDSSNLTARRAYLTCGSTFSTLGLD